MVFYEELDKTRLSTGYRYSN